MENLKRLMVKAESNDCRLKIRFDPNLSHEEWGIKFYPMDRNDSYYYAYNEELDEAARILLDELSGLGKW